ncbi:STAS domain-containing protein [Amycolatopsis sp. NPDC004378]
MGTEEHAQIGDLLEIRSCTPEAGILMLHLRGAMDLDTRALVLAQFRAAVAMRPSMVVLDLTEVGFCGSTGLEALVRLQLDCDEQGIQIQVRPSPHLRKLLEITGLKGVLDLL